MSTNDAECYISMLFIENPCIYLAKHKNHALGVVHKLRLQDEVGRWS